MSDVNAWLDRTDAVIVVLLSFTLLNALVLTLIVSLSTKRTPCTLRLYTIEYQERVYFHSNVAADGSCLFDSKTTIAAHDEADARSRFKHEHPSATLKSIASSDAIAAQT